MAKKSSPPRKRPVKRAVRGVTFEEPATRIGNDDEGLVDGGVAVVMGSDGGAYLVPQKLRNATPPQRAAMNTIQHLVRANITILSQLDEAVAHARYVGLSWDSIGWMVGMSGRGAQKRWGTDD